MIGHERNGTTVAAVTEAAVELLRESELEVV